MRALSRAAWPWAPQMRSCLSYFFALGSGAAISVSAVVLESGAGQAGFTTDQDVSEIRQIIADCWRATARACQHCFVSFGGSNFACVVKGFVLRESVLGPLSQQLPRMYCMPLVLPELQTQESSACQGDLHQARCPLVIHLSLCTPQHRAARHYSPTQQPGCSPPIATAPCSVSRVTRKHGQRLGRKTTSPQAQLQGP